MPYAVNLIDFMANKDDVGLAIILLATGLVDKESAPVTVDKNRVDETALPLDCDDERGQAVVELIRKKYKRHELRCYRSKTGHGGWKRI